MTVFGAVVSLSSPAASLHGFIQKKDGARSLLVQNDDGSQTLLKMAAANPAVQANIDLLKNGDYLVARGTLGPGSVQVDAIESLGLQAIVGVWATSKYEVYEFRDFTRLNLYIPNDNHSNVVKAGEFQYSVAPDQGAKYSIFLSGTNSVTVGSIEFRNHNLLLNVIDPKTGQVSADIVLSPLASARNSK
jgi:hypothetical protein